MFYVSSIVLDVGSLSQNIFIWDLNTFSTINHLFNKTCNPDFLYPPPVVYFVYLLVSTTLLLCFVLTTLFWIMIYLRCTGVMSFSFPFSLSDVHGWILHRILSLTATFPGQTLSSNLTLIYHIISHNLSELNLPHLVVFFFFFVSLFVYLFIYWGTFLLDFLPFCPTKEFCQHA